MLIYCTNPGPRFKYIVTYFIEELCGIQLKVTSDSSEFLSYPGTGICYAAEKLGSDNIFIRPSGLLSETGIQEQNIRVTDWQQLPVFFQTEGDLPFDIFSASFYLLSRYEEYLPHSKDMYGRYSHAGSLAYKQGFIELPLIELWALEFQKLLPGRKLELTPAKRKLRFIPTYDIDIAWTFLHKGFVRNAGGLVRSIVAGDFKQASKRISVLRGKRPDPFDIYEWLDALHMRYSLKPYYFFLVAAGNSNYDKNISPASQHMKSLIAYHASGYRTGIHPSWTSRDNEAVFIKELEYFSSVTQLPVKNNRFHYLAFDLPGSYRKLIRHGITDDFSMGYGGVNGFRASTSSPFFWYDLHLEQVTSLKIHPFCWMDATSYHKLQYTPAQAYAELKKYHDLVKQVGGQLMTISHNDYLSEEPGFAGWKQVYEIFLNEVVYWDV